MATGLRAGEVVDRFTVEYLLGEGGMAAVYSVRHNTLGSRHALKLLKVENDSVRARLVAEGKVQAALRHPNIVAVTDVLVVRGQPGLLMEQVDGPSLDEWLGQNRPSAEDALRLFRGILAGVSRAHRAGLVHRDLKPGNVLLDSSDGLVIPKVADFGLAKILADEEGGHSQTRSGVAMGTPQFMAPEQIRNAKDVDQRADIFALGCILYDLMCGQLPFHDDDLLELYNRIATGRYTPPEDLVPSLAPRVGEAIRACLQVDRSQRPPDCESVGAMLYGDESLTGGVRLTGRYELRPVHRPSPLVAAETRLPAGYETMSAKAPARPPAPPTATLNSGLGYGAMALGAAGLLALAVAGTIGLGWVWYSSRTPEAPVVALPVPAPAVAATGTQEPANAGEASPTSATDRAAAPASAAASGDAVKKVDPKRPAVEAPAPTAPERPAPERPAPERPAPASAEPEPGRVSVRGQVASFSLRGKAGSFGPGEVPPGSYEVVYAFEGREPSTMALKVTSGSTTVVKCDAAFAMCNIAE